jgi:hypothetical protein
VSAITGCAQDSMARRQLTNEEKKNKTGGAKK